MEVTNRYITIKAHIEGIAKESDFEVKSECLSLQLGSGSKFVIVKNLYVSIDPYQMNRMKSCSPSQKALAVTAAIIPGKAIDAYGVGRVVASRDPEFGEGDLVSGRIGWEEYSTLNVGQVSKLDPMGFPLSYHVGVLSHGGLAAYAGIHEIGKAKKGEKVFISAAAGSVGYLAGQYAKLLGCYVVGSAGTTQKVELLKEKLGFDDAFNYKEETDLNSALQRHFPEGIDVYFDNVGGETLEAAVANMNLFGRVALCGVISEYTGSGKRAAPDMIHVVYKRINMRGFLSADHFDVHADFISTTADHLRSGKIQVLEDISSGLESIPSAFVGLFRGDNVGKTIVQIADD